jgi:hypothetical protein
MRDRRWLVILSALAAACAGPLASAHSPMDNKQAHDLAQLVDRSNLVFVGQARKVVYRNARGEKGEGPIPYTIVTYGIERVLRGKAPGGEITMRFVGGPDGRGRFLTVSGVPVVQEGDRDLLFVASTEDASCPLVFCEYGRYRILNEDVFDTHGSPVLAIDKAVVISRGAPPRELQRLRFPAPQFNELLQNPEVAAQLKAQNMSEDDARRRYEAEAPKVIEVEILQDVPVAALAAQVDSRTTPDARSLPLSQLTSELQVVLRRSKRKPVDVRSIDPNAEIVPARLTVAEPQRPESRSPTRRPASEAEAAESRAFEQNDYNPVLRK